MINVYALATELCIPNRIELCPRRIFPTRRKYHDRLKFKAGAVASRAMTLLKCTDACSRCL